MTVGPQLLNVGRNEYHYTPLKSSNLSWESFPVAHKILLENLMRKGGNVEKFEPGQEISYYPGRVLMQDFTGVPAVVDLAAMRDAMKALGGDPEKINPLTPVDLVIDHSVSVEHYGTQDAFKKNVEIEFEQNKERYSFLRWGQKAFKNFRVVPPGTGICHQVNLEYLADVVWREKIDGKTYVRPDTLVGTDSHTTMINGLSVLGWGVGGIEAEAAMLGRPVSMLIPEVVGVELTGKLSEGMTATDLVLRVVEILREKGVVGKFVEFFGSGLSELSLADRATLANMAPEYGATCGLFPVDEETLKYLRNTGRDEELVELVEVYAKEQKLWRDDSQKLSYTDTLSLDLGSICPALAGPKRPQDRVDLDKVSQNIVEVLSKNYGVKDTNEESVVEGRDYTISHGDVVIAAITSCTNTSNPSVMVAAGLLAREARKRGLKAKPWVKTSLAPGSQVVTAYLEDSGLAQDLAAIGFHNVGHGCTTCIGNSGPLLPEISKSIHDKDMTVCSVLSGNRNFEGRISPDVKANYLASPPLVVAYSLLGNMQKDITKESLGKDSSGNDVYLKDIWPSNALIAEVVGKHLTREVFLSRYGNVFEGSSEWQKIETSSGQTYDWPASTYIKNPPYFAGMGKDISEIKNVEDAKVLLMLGDSVTTDHISPAGRFPADGPAGQYLVNQGVKPANFNSFGSRRGNHEVMMRGTFANIRIKNELVGGKEGGYTKVDGQECSVFDGANKYREKNQALIVIAGKEYGTGSSRDWAAKGTNLLGVKAVIAESFERIHRSNLVGMGVLPFQFLPGEGRKSLKLNGDEEFTLLSAGVKAQEKVTLKIKRKDGSVDETQVICRIDTVDELGYVKNGGILQTVLRKLL